MHRAAAARKLMCTLHLVWTLLPSHPPPPPPPQAPCSPLWSHNSTTPSEAGPVCTGVAPLSAVEACVQDSPEHVAAFGQQPTCGSV